MIEKRFLMLRIVADALVSRKHSKYEDFVELLERSLPHQEDYKH